MSNIGKPKLKSRLNLPVFMEIFYWRRVKLLSLADVCDICERKLGQANFVILTFRLI